MVAVVTGIGTALPAETRSTNFYVDHAKQFFCQTPRQGQVLEELYRRTQISSRASVLNSPAYGTSMELIYSPDRGGAGPGTAERMRCYNNEVLQLALTASLRALEDSGIECDTITHLVTVSCTGFFAPGFDIQLIQQIPLRLDVQRTHIGFMGCHGAMNALRIARGLVESDSSNVVLMCAAELCSLHFQYEWTADNLIANAIFADGAAAIVVRSEAATEVSNKEADAESLLRLVASGSLIVPHTSEAMTWKIGDHGFEMRLAATVPDIINESLPGWLDKWLGQCGYSRSEITSWIVHPGGPRILDAVEHCLNLEENSLSASRAILSEYGNMSSPTVLFVLERMRRSINGPCVMLGFGPGLTIEAALLAG